MKIELPELKKQVYETRFPVRWGDMDAMGHVNNAQYFRYLETARIDWMRGMGLNPLADRLRTAALRVDTALAGVAQADIHSGAQVQQTARALAVLKHLAESEVAPALKVSIGFSDADGD